MEATLRCDSSSSNPPAELTWWRDGIPVEMPHIVQSSKVGLWGGTTSSTELKINVTQDMNGVVYTCQSANTALERSVHEVATLHVLCKLTRGGWDEHGLAFPTPSLSLDWIDSTD